MNTQELKKLKLQYLKDGDQMCREAVDAVLTEIEIIENRQNKVLDDLAIDSVIKKTASMFFEREQLASDANRPSDEFKYKGNFLLTFLPNQLTEEKIAEAVRKGIVETNAQTIGEMGKVMAWLKTQYGSSIDMKSASQKVRGALVTG
jgi:uncharacterized protein YqeY